ncbi:MAG: PHA/PHB synthase family protein [Novosphingobium sp.]
MATGSFAEGHVPEAGDSPEFSAEDAGLWLHVGARLIEQWRKFLVEIGETREDKHTAVSGWIAQACTLASGWLGATPFAQIRPPADYLEQAEALWKQFAFPDSGEAPVLAMLGQTHRLFVEQLQAAAEATEGLGPFDRDRLQFAIGMLADTIDPANFPLTNPEVLARARKTGGESLVHGFEHLLADLRRGQLTHSDPSAFRLGENLATTPGKVVHETQLYQLIQYTPTTAKVLATPLVIFPPWINRFYILDLDPRKSFVRWTVEQGISTFMVSWKSADQSMADVTWDDYIAAQIDAIDHIRQRLSVPSVHTIGYCVAGTTLAATLAILARRSEVENIESATFLTAQVDFTEAGDLKHFIDDTTIAAVEQCSPQGYLDGRCMAAIFNLLRPRDLIWSFVRRHYLLGEDYRAFDMLHWNGDVTNLPARWQADYMRDLYRDNRLAEPDSLSALGTPIDLTRVDRPCYIQAGREDHIAPPSSVWKATRHFRGPVTFVLAGSGHIAGVVNPPSRGKYQYWTNPDAAESLEQFVSTAEEHPGSWWPHWLGWLRSHGRAEVAVRGKRKPGGRNDKVIEDAPGRYVRMR